MAKKLTTQGLYTEISRLSRVVAFQHTTLCDTWAWAHRALPVLETHAPDLAAELRQYIAHHRADTWMPPEEDDHGQEVPVAA